MMTRKDTKRSEQMRTIICAKQKDRMSAKAQGLMGGRLTAQYLNTLADSFLTARARR